MTELLDVLPYALAGTSFALGARHGSTRRLLILTGYSGIVPPLVSE
jgi:hypothetical protein